jgi:hypothetical protein
MEVDFRQPARVGTTMIGKKKSQMQRFMTDRRYIAPSRKRTVMVATKFWGSSQPRITVYYHQISDELFIVLGSAGPKRSQAGPEGIELGYAIDGAPCGVKVFGYKRNGWAKNVEKLAKIAGSHLSAKPNDISRAILAAVR